MKHVFLACVALGLSVAGASGQTEHIQRPNAPATGPYLDTGSGMTFPAALGDFHRFRLTRRGEDISAGYAHDLAKGRMVVTVFVQRPPAGVKTGLCGKMADGYRKGILEDHPGATFPDLTAPSNPGYSAIAFSVKGGDDVNGMDVSERYLYCPKGDAWLVEYDFQHAAAFDAAATEAEFLQGLKPTLTQKP